MEKKKIPLVFLHGLGADLHQVESMIVYDQLITFDMPAHGGIPLPESRITFNLMAQFVEERLTELNISEYVIGGISMGAAIALRVALDHPHRCRGLLEVRPAWDCDGMPENNQAIFKHIGQLLSENDRELAKKYYSESSEFIKYKKRYPYNAKRMIDLFEDKNAGINCRRFLEISTEKPFNLDEIKSIDFPVFIIATRFDPLHSLALAKRLEKQLQAAEFSEIIAKPIDAVKHQLQLNHRIERFMNKVNLSSNID